MQWTRSCALDVSVLSSVTVICFVILCDVVVVVIVVLLDVNLIFRYFYRSHSEHAVNIQWARSEV